MVVTINQQNSELNIRPKKDRPTYEDCKNILNQCFKNNKSKEGNNDE